ncbi:hypothetical protein [Candidatus Rariloculus sp.]|uniref:COG4648 family protein n=1 Tax=Candidatus Rariloculus sp. TaxID=3101265 RepID=UPI003D12B7EF
MTKAISRGFVVALGVYPLLVYFGLLYFDATWVAGWLLALCILRLFASRFGVSAAVSGNGILISCAGGILLALISVIGRSHQAILFNPVVVNLTMLIVFTYSLIYPPSMIERIAHLRRRDIPRTAIAYMRNLTFVWAAFFFLNGAAALYTALYTSLETWTLYNGLIAYLLIAMLFGGEWIVRGFLARDGRA